MSLPIIWSCDRPEREPWVRDPILQDMVKRKKDTEAKIAAQTAEIEKLQAILETSQPQTGQIRTARKKVEAHLNILAKTKQLLRIQKIQIESRIAQAQSDYIVAFKEKKPWPPKSEYSEYLLQQKLISQNRVWSAERRKEEVGLPPSKRSVAAVDPKSEASKKGSK